jgi:signal transduction histidine kinase
VVSAATARPSGVIARLSGFVARLSLRARLLLIGTGGLAVGFALGGLVLVAALAFALERSVDRDALATANDVAALVDAGALPQPVPVAGGQLVQVVDAQQRVRSASIGADRLVPLLRPDELAAAREGRRRYISGARAGLSGPLRVVAVPAGPADDPQTVVVARPVTEVRQSVALLRLALLVAYPLLLVALAALAYRVVGAALRPVEALRSGAERITGGDGGGRLPVPRSRDEIHRLAVTLNDMLDRLAAGRARQRAFVADAAHELRSPLANMRTQLEVAQLLGERTDWPAVSRDLLADTDRLTRLVDDLLLLARADEPAVDAARAYAPVELRAVLTAVAERYRAARVPVSIEPGDPQWTLGDRHLLERVVTNLVDNGVRHARSRVRLAAVPERGQRVLSVVDDGPGIPSADRERVFGRFARRDDARARDAGGAGLGLAIVRELVRRHGGSVRLADAEPGVRAEVRLPAVDPPEVA